MVCDHHIANSPLFRKLFPDALFMPYSISRPSDQIPNDPGATLSFRNVGEKEYVALHAINYRFSFTEKRQKGELNEKHEIVHFFPRVIGTFPV